MLRRILALLAKELAGLWKDRKTRFVILIPPLVQVVIFAYAATYDVKDVGLGIWNEDAGMHSADLVRRFAGSPAFHVAAMPQPPAQAAEAIDSQKSPRCCTCRRIFPPTSWPGGPRRRSF